MGLKSIQKHWYQKLDEHPNSYMVIFQIYMAPRYRASSQFIAVFMAINRVRLDFFTPDGCSRVGKCPFWSFLRICFTSPSNICWRCIPLVCWCEFLGHLPTPALLNGPSVPSDRQDTREMSDITYLQALVASCYNSLSKDNGSRRHDDAWCKQAMLLSWTCPRKVVWDTWFGVVFPHPRLCDGKKKKNISGDGFLHFQINAAILLVGTSSCYPFYWLKWSTRETFGKHGYKMLQSSTIPPLTAKVKKNKF